VVARGIALALAAFLVAGCGATYTAEQAQTSFARHGIVARTVTVEGIGRLLHLNLGCGGDRDFASLRLAVNDLSIDYFAQIEAQLTFAGGSVIVFCGRYDAARYEQAIREAHGVHVGRVERRGNLLLFESGRRPRVEAAFAAIH